jgi:hypothetical protein
MRGRIGRRLQLDLELVLGISTVAAKHSPDSIGQGGKILRDLSLEADLGATSEEPHPTLLSSQVRPRDQYTLSLENI